VSEATVALATCSDVPDLDDDERLVIPELAALGVQAVPRVWDDPSTRWHEHDMVVIRCTWDYAKRRNDFLRWVESLPRVLNPPPVIAWNTDKLYLRDLVAAGIAVVPTLWVEPGTPAGAIPLPDGDVVVKPAVSSGAQHTSRYRSGDESRARSHVERLAASGRTVMIQPYIASVDRDGGTGLIYIDGCFSHAVAKGPLLRSSVETTDQLWAPEDITVREARADERQLAETALAAAPLARDELLYARVDVVRGHDGAPMILELELTEPSLFLAHGQNAAARLAAGIARRLQADDAGRSTRRAQPEAAPPPPPAHPNPAGSSYQG
jgi:glutathione synthase/RimK-type ligase-like ATP-grasp enzyme